jgi:hypothetical protein
MPERIFFLQESASRRRLTSICLIALAGCAGGSGSSIQNPISVYLPISTIELTTGAAPVTIPIQIASTSETALVSVSGLPAGVQVKYASTDTNPSGSLTFDAIDATMTGETMPRVTVMSAGQTASTSFTLVVKSP